MADGVEQRLRELGEFIRSQRESARLSLRGLSSRTGISNPYLSQIERGLRKPSAEILQQIARGLAISAETLYERAGILDPRERRERPDVVAAIEADPHLDPRQKRALVEVYRSMRRDPGERDPGERDPGGPGAGGEPPEPAPTGVGEPGRSGAAAPGDGGTPPGGR